MRIFKEQQRFTQQWLIAILIISSIAPTVILTKEFLKENSTLNTKTYVLILGIILGSMLLIFLFKLKTRIDEIGIHYQFFPFHLSYRKILWKDVEKCETRKYDAISEYGGWGMKGGRLWKKKNGVAYNVKGDIGLQLQLKNGEKILIGTQKQNDVDLVISKYTQKES